MTLRELLSEKVKELSQRQGWSQQQLAQRSGVSQTGVSKVLRPDSGHPRLDTIEAIAKAFRVPLWYLLAPFRSTDERMAKDVVLLVDHYLSASDESREWIMRAALRESSTPKERQDEAIRRSVGHKNSHHREIVRIRKKQ